MSDNLIGRRAVVADGLYTGTIVAVEGDAVVVALDGSLDELGPGELPTDACSRGAASAVLWQAHIEEITVGPAPAAQT